MKVWGVGESQLRDIATALSVNLYELREDGRALRFTLRPTGEKRNGNYVYQRTSASGFRPERRVHAVCWHGHRDFMREVFRVNPEARIKTGWADYKGAENFEDTFEATGYRNVGSTMYPVYASQVCKCSEGDWIVDLSVSANVQTYKIKQSDVLACPFVILVPDHYRADGTCKCDDPEEQARMIREWDYTPADFVNTGR